MDTEPIKMQSIVKNGNRSNPLAEQMRSIKLHANEIVEFPNEEKPKRADANIWDWVPYTLHVETECPS